MLQNSCALMISLILASSVFATENRALTATEVERYDKVTHALIAPCCWREPIAVHRSPEALQMLDEVKQLVMDGHSEDEIKGIYVARYGCSNPGGPSGERRAVALHASGLALLLPALP